jgi:hypothetical protein
MVWVSHFYGSVDHPRGRNVCVSFGSNCQWRTTAQRNDSAGVDSQVIIEGLRRNCEHPEIERSMLTCEVRRFDAIAHIESLQAAAWANGLERDEANDRLGKIHGLLNDRHNAVRIEAAQELARPVRLTKVVSE